MRFKIWEADIGYILCVYTDHLVHKIYFLLNELYQKILSILKRTEIDCQNSPHIDFNADKDVVNLHERSQKNKAHIRTDPYSARHGDGNSPSKLFSLNTRVDSHGSYWLLKFMSLCPVSDLFYSEKTFRLYLE